jgi:hypothetical protein
MKFTLISHSFERKKFQRLFIIFSRMPFPATDYYYRADLAKFYGRINDMDQQRNEYAGWEESCWSYDRFREALMVVLQELGCSDIEAGMKKFPALHDILVYEELSWSEAEDEESKSESVSNDAVTAPKPPLPQYLKTTLMMLRSHAKKPTKNSVAAKKRKKSTHGAK